LIKKITEIVENNTLKVSVECSVREYAKYPIKILTTEKIIDIIKNKYNIVKTLKSPNKQVGNTKKNYITNSGTWLFEILLEEKEETKIEPKPTRKRKTTTRKKSPSPSIRGRISKLATKED
tara:strand:+ start:609 stop:971 length:363 start_codon:yes stop_codon:yes gene_type:complete